MEINENSGEFISLEEAQAYVTEYRKRYPDEIKAYFFGNVKIKYILEQANCMGLRIYNGFSEKTSMTNLVIVGVDCDGKDMTSGLILQKGMPCPTNCDPGSDLN